MRTIRASEIGTFLFCKRAWWYQQQGIQSANQDAMASGTRLHQLHGRKVFAAGFLRLVGWLLLLAALILIAVTGTMALF
jgi:CRISPR/Cas system-associated exonuclease Cas4 (RecB family)